MNDVKEFPPCVICGADDWRLVHAGAVRDGAFGSHRRAEVRRCGGCAVDRLAESACLQPEAYESTEYRSRLGQDHDIQKHYSTHDALARFTLEALSTMSLRGKTIA